MKNIYVEHAQGGPVVAPHLLFLGPNVKDPPGQLPMKLCSRGLNPVVHLTPPCAVIYTSVINPPYTARWCFDRQSFHES